MTSLFPHTPYAEDQPYAHSILYLHVIRASAMSFTFISLIGTPISILVARYRKTPVDPQALLSRTLTISGRSLVLGTVAGAAMTWGRMRNREDIEWKDRSWRILENKGEVDTDWVTVGGAGVGAVTALAAARRGMVPGGVGHAVLGGAGVGMSIGVPYMIASFARGRRPA